MRYALPMFLLVAACDSGPSDACLNAPSQQQVFFPLTEGTTWSYIHTFEREVWFEGAPRWTRTVAGDITWELRRVQCEGDEVSLNLQVTYRGDTLDEDLRDGEQRTDHVYGSGELVGRTIGGRLLIPSYTGPQATGLGSSNFQVPMPRLFYPATAQDTVRVDTSWVEVLRGFATADGYTEVTLVRNEGIVAWYGRIATAEGTYLEEATLRRQ